MEQNLEAARQRHVPQAAITPALLAGRNERFFSFNASAALECGYLGYALERDEAAIVSDLRESSQSFHAGVMGGGPIDLWQFITQLSLSVVLKNATTMKVLSDLARARYTAPGVTFPEPMFLAAEVEADMIANRLDSAWSRLDDALLIMANGKIPRAIRNDVEPVLLMEGAILRANSAELAASVRKRIENHVRKFSNPLIRNLPEGVVDIWGLALMQLARSQGIDPDVASVYFPSLST